MRRIAYKLLVPAVLVAVTALINPSARAVGLGSVEVASHLNQPLRAEIPLRSVEQLDADDIRVQLAEPEDFMRIGLDRHRALTHLDFAVERGPSGMVIRISSEAPVREPFLSFLLRVDWPQGRLLREYTILLDPPVLAPAAVPDREPAPTRAVERAPAESRIAEPETRREVTAPAAAGEYGPVAGGETLWRIASNTRPSDVSVNQMMLALLRTNPDAFFEDNINALRRGAVLRIPDRDEIQRLSTAQAVEAVRRQNDLWQDYRRNLAQAAPAVVEGGEEPARAPAAEREPADDSRLELVPPRAAEESVSDAEAGPAAPGDLEAEGEALRAELARTREDLLAERQESGELSSRVGELENQVERLQRLLDMKNEELAALQSGTDEPADATDGDEPAPGEMTFDVPGEEESVAGTDEPAAESEEELAAQEPAPAQAAVSEPPSAPERSGWLQWLLQPVVMGIFGLLLIAVGVALFLHRRREGVAATTLRREALEVKGARDEPEPKVKPAPAPPKEVPPRESGPAGYDAAALQAALAENPEDTETRLKLLRHYAAVGEREAFEAEAETLYAQLADPASPAWREVRDMGVDLAPDNPLFGGGDIRAGLTEDFGAEEPRTDAEDRESDERETWDELGDLEYDMSGEPEPAPEDEIPAGEGEEPEERPEYRLEDLDTGDEGYDFDTPPAVPEDETRQREAAPEEPGEHTVRERHFDLDDTVEPREERGDEASAELELEGFGPDAGEPVPEERAPEEEAPAGGGAAAGEDPVATKLELAEAYVDMGDEDGARDLLEEVLREGSEAQQAKAKEMLEQLG